MYRITPTVRAIIVTNVILWLLTILLFQLKILDLNNVLALHFPLNPNYGIWQFVTHIFMHANLGPSGIVIFHLAFNMIGVWMFGSPLESSWGRNKFLFFYFSTGIGAALAHMAILYLQYGAGDSSVVYNQMLGASGALYGILVAFAMMNPNAQIMLIFLPIPIKAKYFVAILIGLDLFLGFSGTNTGIAHFAHIGGALIGFMMMWYWKKDQFNQNRWDR